jgi:23S rRNA U2552 (ribose-2'-O)-methylase RlmE/FtsJ
MTPNDDVNLPSERWIETNNTTLYLNELHRKLNNAMSRIDNINNSKWHYYRKLLNIYDFTSRKIATNRAFYKLWELLITIPDFHVSCIKNSCHLAEAPGSFVEVIDKLNPNANKIAVSKPPLLYSEVLKDSTTTPLFAYNITKKVHNCKFEYLDLLNNESLRQFIECHRQEYDFITADGGIDDNGKYCDKEKMHYKLIFSEITSILFLMKKNGNCILKIFDCYTDTTIHLIYFLVKHFKHFDIIKPKTSRPTNSEKYIVCLDFKGTDYKLDNCLDLLDNIDSTKDNYILSQNIPVDFKKFLLERISLYVVNQINSINDTVDYIECNTKISKSILYGKKDKVYKEWKIDYGLN